MPSSCGMRMSISTTSGRCRSTAREHAAPVVGLADDLDALRAGQHHPQPRAHERVVVDEQDADGRRSRRPRQRRAQDEVAARVGPVLELAAGQRDALGQPDQAGAGARERERARSRRRRPRGG